MKISKPIQAQLEAGERGAVMITTEDTYKCDYCQDETGQFNTETGNHPVCEEASRALEMAGEAKTLAEALDQWEEERQALAELFDENQAFAISFRLYDLTMSLAEQVIGLVEKEAAMFITENTRSRIAAFYHQMRALDKRRATDRQNIIDANGRTRR